MIIEKTRLVADEVLIITSQIQYNNLIALGIGERIIIDTIPGKAALGGIYTGLLCSNNQYNLIIACDMPFLNIELIKYMVNEATGYDALVPSLNSFLEPLHAIYSKTCIPIIEKFIDDEILSLNKLFSLIKTRYLTIDEIKKYDPYRLSIFNINTQDDYLKAIEIMHDYK